MDLKAIGPDWDMFCRIMLINCLLDAVEHDSAQVKVRWCYGFKG
jgi:hypothetical protein